MLYWCLGLIKYVQRISEKIRNRYSEEGFWWPFWSQCGSVGIRRSYNGYCLIVYLFSQHGNHHLFSAVINYYEDWYQMMKYPFSCKLCFVKIRSSHITPEPVSVQTRRYNWQWYVWGEHHWPDQKKDTRERMRWRRVT